MEVMKNTWFDQFTLKNDLLSLLWRMIWSVYSDEWFAQFTLTDVKCPGGGMYISTSFEAKIEER